MAFRTKELELFRPILEYFQDKQNPTTLSVNSKEQEKVDSGYKKQKRKQGTPISLGTLDGRESYFIHEPDQKFKVKSVQVNPTHQIEGLSDGQLDHILETLSEDVIKIYLVDIAAFLGMIAALLNAMEARYLGKKATQYKQFALEDIVSQLKTIDIETMLSLHNEILSLMNLVRALSTIQTLPSKKTQQTLSIPILLHLKRRLIHLGFASEAHSQRASANSDSLTP